MSPSVIRTLLITFGILLPGTFAHAQASAPLPGGRSTTEFIENHCANCHNDVDREGGLDLTVLTFRPEDRDNFALWVKVHDRLRAGEMPPKEKKRPPAGEIESVVLEVAASLTAHEKTVAARDGRATQRRLNRGEYENALADLLDAPWLQVRDQLPEDGEAHHYNKVSAALDVSYVHMGRYLSAADYALRQAMSVAFARPETSVRRHYARESFTFRSGGDDGNPDRQKFPVLGTQAQPDVLTRKAPMTVGAADPATREREAVGWVSSNYSTGFQSVWGGFRAPATGRYRLRFSGYTVWVGPGGTRTPTLSFIGKTPPGGDPTQIAVLPPEWHRPNFALVSPGRRYEPITVYAKGGTLNRRIGAFDITPEPSVRELNDVWLQANDVIAVDAVRFFRPRPTGVPDGYTNPLAQRDGMPGVAFRWMEVEGPFYDAPKSPGYALLFGDLPMRKVDAGVPGVTLEVASPPPAVTTRATRSAPLAHVRVEVESASPLVDAERLLRGFMMRAYRGPVVESDVRLFLDVIRGRLDAGLGFAGAMLSGYTAVLSSPGFVYVREKPGRLDNEALATRLALLLWNSTPDSTLRAIAARGDLHRPEVLRAQADRLLADPRSSRFVDAFLDYWLEIRKVNDTSPSTALYSDYAVDDALVEASLEETRLYLSDLLARDLPARNIVDSNYTFLNDRLANHYQIPGVDGVAMRRVQLPPGSPRGGLLTQASVLKVTANGTTTSPVMRGKWVSERIMGFDIPPPPPAVPAVEPDIRGAVTIREQLARHREDKACAACHVKIDPPGFALESFDVMGAWRERYRATSTDGEVEAGIGHNGWPFTFHYAQPVDASGTLADGRSFRDVRDFKRLLLADEKQIARNLARQLAVYATGAPVRFSDRPAIERILQRAALRDYGVRTLLLEIIQSDLFLNK